MEAVPLVAVGLAVLAVALIAASVAAEAPGLRFLAIVAAAWAGILWVVHRYVSRRQ